MSDLKLVARLYRKIWKLRADLRASHDVEAELRRQLVAERQDRLFSDMAKSADEIELRRDANR